MSTTATADHNPEQGAYDGPLHVEIGLPLLPARYAGHGDWSSIHGRLLADLTLLRRQNSGLFAKITHQIAEGVFVIEQGGGGR